MIFTKAAAPEFAEIRSFYWYIIDNMRGTKYDPEWEKGIYPSDKALSSAISKGQLYILRNDDRQLLGAFIADQNSNEGYSNVTWGVDAPPSKVLMLHALGVDPAKQRQGIGKRLVKEAIGLASRTDCLSIRLDVLSGNEPALRLYEGAGFKLRSKEKMYYEDTGWKDFYIYELIL